LSGKPAIKGTSISVEAVLEYLAHNPDFDALFVDYPRLTMNDVTACFAYAQRLVEAIPPPSSAATSPLRFLTDEDVSSPLRRIPRERPV
jgi:uncharacterized protein (DUF433 family)